MSGLFLNPGMGTSGAWNKSLRLLSWIKCTPNYKEKLPQKPIQAAGKWFSCSQRWGKFFFSFTTVVMLKGTAREVSKLPSLYEMGFFKHVLIKFITFMTFVMLRGTMRERCPTCWYGATLQITQAVSANFQHSPALKGDEEKYSRGLYWTALSATL